MDFKNYSSVYELEISESPHILEIKKLDFLSHVSEQVDLEKKLGSLNDSSTGQGKLEKWVLVINNWIFY